MNGHLLRSNSLQRFVKRKSRHSRLLLANLLLLGCATKVIKADHSDDEPFDVTDPKQVIVPNEQSGQEADVVLQLHTIVSAIAMDEQRLFWRAGGLQSCRIDDCVATFVTYPHSSKIVAFSLGNEFIGWQEEIAFDGRDSTSVLWGSPLLDTDPEPRQLTTGLIASFAMTDKLYWWTDGDSVSLQRCDPRDCAGTQESLVTREPSSARIYIDGLVLSSTHAYWLEGSTEAQGARRIRRVQLDGDRRVETLVQSETEIRGMSLRDGRLVWTINNYSSPIQFCNVDDCVDSTVTLMASQDYPNRVATSKKYVVWATPKELRSCQLLDCESTVELVAKGHLEYFVTDNALTYATYPSSTGTPTTQIHLRRLP